MMDDIISMDDTVAKEKKNILFQDDLSGTYTKDFFFEAGKILLQLAKRNQVSLMVGVVKIDGFQDIDEKYNEKITALTAEIIENKCRKSDLISYMGNGQIGLIFYNTTNANAKIALENIRAKVENSQYEINNKNIAVTVSIGGIAMHNLMTAGAITALYEQAENAVQNASKKGNCVVVY